MKYFLIIFFFIGLFIIGCFGDDNCPTCPSSNLNRYIITAIKGNGLSVQVNSFCNIEVLVTNKLGIPIEKCKIDWEIIQGDAIFYNTKTKFLSSITQSGTLIKGKASAEILLGESPGTIKVKATIFATGDSVTFVLTGIA